MSTMIGMVVNCCYQLVQFSFRSKYDVYLLSDEPDWTHSEQDGHALLNIAAWKTVVRFYHWHSSGHLKFSQVSDYLQDTREYSSNGNKTLVVRLSQTIRQNR